MELSGEQGTLSLAQGFITDETKTLTKGAARILASGQTDMVIMGHTHERVEPSKSLAYINTGCWTRYFQFQPKHFKISWDMLKPQAAEYFPYKLDFAEIIAPGREGVQLRTFHFKP